MAPDVLPIIVLRDAVDRIDDGCHRAVAMVMAGRRTAMAYVGLATAPESPS